MKQLKAGNFKLDETFICDFCETTLKITSVSMLIFKYDIGGFCPICKAWHGVKLPRNLREKVMCHPSGFVPDPMVVLKSAWWNKVVICEGCEAHFQIEHADVYDFESKKVSKTQKVYCSECGLPLFICSSSD